MGNWSDEPTIKSATHRKELEVSADIFSKKEKAIKNAAQLH